MTKLIIAIMLISNLSYAQKKIDPDLNLKSREGGGGDDSIAEEVIILNMIKSNLLKLEKFLRTDKRAQDYFPEIDQEVFSSKILNLIHHNKIKLIRDGSSENDNLKLTEIHDMYGVPRTAVNYPSTNIVEYDFEKIKELQDSPKMLFVLNAHEVLSLMGIEKNDPEISDQYMGYKVSGRFSKFVTKVESFDLVFSEVQNNDNPSEAEGKYDFLYPKDISELKDKTPFRTYVKVVVKKGFKKDAVGLDGKIRSVFDKPGEVIFIKHDGYKGSVTFKYKDGFEFNYTNTSNNNLDEEKASPVNVLFKKTYVNVDSGVSLREEIDMMRLTKQEDLIGNAPLSTLGDLDRAYLRDLNTRVLSLKNDFSFTDDSSDFVYVKDGVTHQNTCILRKGALVKYKLQSIYWNAEKEENVLTALAFYIDYIGEKSEAQKKCPLPYTWKKYKEILSMFNTPLF